MVHGAHTPAHLLPRWYLLTATVLVILTVWFGSLGGWQYELDRGVARPDGWSVFYHACQLLIMHAPHLEAPVNWQLHAGRMAGVAFVFLSAGLALFALFRHEVLRLQLPWRRGHVVVCGLGDLGLRLALNARRLGKFVVAIEKHGPTSIERARSNGVLVLEGDATDDYMLRRARVRRAAHVIAACLEDRTNVAVAALVGAELGRSTRSGPALLCRLLVRDAALAHLLADQSLLVPRRETAAAKAAKYRVNFQNLDFYDTAARQTLRRHPLDFQPISAADKTVAHLVVAGFGRVGQSLAVQAARIGHFANSAGSGRPVKITLVDREVEKRLGELRERCPKIGDPEICDLVLREVREKPSEIIGVLSQVSHEAVKAGELITYAICFDGSPTADRENLLIGLPVSRAARGLAVQTLVYQTTRQGFAALLAAEPRTSGFDSRLHAFGMSEEIYNWDVLMHEAEDVVAKALHERYRLENPASGHPPWDELREDFRESNRHAADHIPVKLRALGYHDAPVQRGKERIVEFTDDETLLAAKMEHRRWCAERWLDGWEYGPQTIRENRISSALVDWDRLSPEEKQKDIRHVRGIIDVLYAAGRAIYR